jgi:YesN/AraC family two-component response regulator
MKIPKETYTVLVVDDEKKICRLIKSYLSLSVYFDNIVMATNAVEAIQKMQNQTFDLLITDQVMPGKMGIDLIDHVTKTPKLQKTRVMLISGYLKQEVLLKAVNRGVKSIIVKPFSRLQLLDAAYEVLDLEKNPRTILYKNLIDISIDEDNDVDDTDFDGYE